MEEVHLLHGLLLQALLMEEGARGLGVRVSYRDAEGDLVGIQSDNALRYAYEDWRKMACRQPRKHPFMRVVVAVATSPRENTDISIDENELCCLPPAIALCETTFIQMAITGTRYSSRVPSLFTWASMMW